MKNLKRILKKGGIITAQVGCQDKKPKQVGNWLKVLEKNFGNVKLSVLLFQVLIVNGILPLQL